MGKITKIKETQYIWCEIIKKGKIETLLEAFLENIKDHDFHIKFQDLRFQRFRANAMKKPL